MFTGCGTALVTPFQKDLSLDEQAFRRLVRRQIESGINFLVPCGTTGESPTLERHEHLRIVEMTLEEAKGKVPVLAGAGGYNTAEVIGLAKELEAMGVDGILSVTPYYNKPTQEGLYQHYKAVASAIRLPVVVYSVQGRTGVNVETATLRRLQEIDNIWGVKEASGNMAQIAAVIARTDLAVLSGDDAITLAVVAHGGVGVISVVSNVDPGRMTKLAGAARAGHLEEAREIQRALLPLMEACFIESNPIPVKAALGLMGLIEPVYRLPLVPPQPVTLNRMEEVLRSLELLEPANARG